jgi:hypothetical protein
MNYDEATRGMSLPLAMKMQFFDQIIKPHLKKKPATNYLSYFYDQAWLAWRIKIKETDVKKMLSVEWICEELTKSFANSSTEKDSFSPLSNHLIIYWLSPPISPSPPPRPILHLRTDIPAPARRDLRALDRRAAGNFDWRAERGGVREI